LLRVIVLDNHKKNKLDEILSILPVVEKINLKSEADFYGASYMVSKKMKLNSQPRSPVGWKHGWLLADLKYKEQLTIGSNALRFLVPSKKDELFLQERGISAKAIGMPFVYIEDVEPKNINRVENSLLVMPPHSLPYTEHVWDEESYAKQIFALKDKFDLIVVCIHQSCIAKKLWIEVFDRYNIPWVIGADAQDKNSLLRIYRLFSSFEYLTTNVIGSHVVYGAYCGCKVSIFGKYAEFSKEDYKNDSFYQRFPFLLEYNLSYTTRESIAKKFPFLFVHPKEATTKIEWAKQELGEENKVSFEELSRLLGWGYGDQLLWFFKRVYIKLSSKFFTYKRKRNIS